MTAPARMSFDVAQDWLSTRALGLDPARDRLAVDAVLAELDRRELVAMAQSAVLADAQAEQDRACRVIREATEVLDLVRIERDQLRDRVAELEGRR